MGPVDVDSSVHLFEENIPTLGGRIEADSDVKATLDGGPIPVYNVSFLSKEIGQGGCVEWTQDERA